MKSKLLDDKKSAAQEKTSENIAAQEAKAATIREETAKKVKLAAITLELGKAKAAEKAAVTKAAGGKNAEFLKAAEEAKKATAAKAAEKAAVEAEVKKATEDRVASEAKALNSE